MLYAAEDIAATGNSRVVTVLLRGSTGESKHSKYEADDEISKLSLIPALGLVAATDDSGRVALLDDGTLATVASWDAHEHVCAGAALLNAAQIAASSQPSNRGGSSNAKSRTPQSTAPVRRPKTVDVVTLGVDYTILTWKVPLSSNSSATATLTSQVNLLSALPSQRSASGSSTSYNPPLIMSHLSTVLSGTTPYHVLGLGSGGLLFLRPRGRRPGKRAFAWPTAATRSGPWHGWEAVEVHPDLADAVSPHRYFVEQLMPVPGSPTRIASGCSDGTLAVWDLARVFDAPAPVATAVAPVKVSAAVCLGVYPAVTEAAEREVWWIVSGPAVEQQQRDGGLSSCAMVMVTAPLREEEGEGKKKA
ncbi:hypothetical protein H9P43_000819 [Blastocladiella emersonii ATCC 22665]|nr:hypothetical protein H9P43_000819 [Blastocladiella emersonii ATCC 22665]